MTRPQRLFIYLTLSILLLVAVYTVNSTSNYNWSGVNKNSNVLTGALRHIFLFKSLFWLIILNSAIFIVSTFRQNRQRKALIYTTALCLFFLLFNALVNRLCAPYYYLVFQNQTVAEEYINIPLQRAGVSIAPILVEHIDNKNMAYRRYAIQQLANFKYAPVNSTLKRIMNDTTEESYIREDAHQALISINK